MTLAAGKSCLFSVDCITDSDVGEMDGDFGLNQSNLCAEVAGQDVCSGEYFLTIQDAPVTSPEPSSLLLLGAGFVGLFGSVECCGVKYIGKGAVSRPASRLLSQSQFYRTADYIPSAIPLFSNTFTSTRRFNSRPCGSLLLAAG